MYIFMTEGSGSPLSQLNIACISRLRSSRLVIGRNGTANLTVPSRETIPESY